MKICAVLSSVLILMLNSMACSGPNITIEEENVLAALSNIQQGLENNVSYEEFMQLLDQAKLEIDRLKTSAENNACFMGAVRNCYSFYNTGGKAWRQKMNTTDEARKNDMDLTLSVLQSRAALNIQLAGNCYNN
ncbi:MAG: hypothetical protein QNJ26_12540 [Desulfobacterales bacterium]|nr:hypothetical protein [Desulfobacterales bacterium]